MGRKGLAKKQKSKGKGCSAEACQIHLLPVSIEPQAKALQDKAKATALEDKTNALEDKA